MLERDIFVLSPVSGMRSPIMKNKLWEDCRSIWQQAEHSAGTHQGLVSLWFPAEKYGLRRYGVGKKDLQVEEEDYILNNLILKNFFHAESLCLLYLTLSLKRDF